MNKVLTPVFAAVFAFSAQIALAGGPVVVADEAEVVAEKPASSVGVLPVIIVAVALCAAFCGQDDPPKKTCVAIDC